MIIFVGKNAHLKYIKAMTMKECCTAPRAKMQSNKKKQRNQLSATMIIRRSLPTSQDALIFFLCKTSIFLFSPASCPVVAESLIEDVAVLQHFTVHWQIPPQTNPPWKKPIGEDGNSLSSPASISGIVTHSLLSHFGE